MGTDRTPIPTQVASHNSPLDGDEPMVSVILAVRNEKASIAAVLDSLVAQQSDGYKLEVLVLDGQSTDGSRNIIEDYCKRYSHVKLIENPGYSAPYAFNTGLEAASGYYVGIFGAHAFYKPNYIQVCLETLIRKKATACSGRVLITPDINDVQSRIVAFMMGLPFTCSSSSYRSAQQGFVHSVPFGIFLKKALLEVGGYDVALIRNQDNDMNRRLRDAGHRLYLTFDTEASYKPDLSISGSMRYAFNSGAWNIYTLGKRPPAMRWYHFVPFVFISTLFLLLLGGITVGASGFTDLGAFLIAGACTVLVLHILVGFLSVVLQNKSETRWSIPGWGYLLTPFLALGFHLSYGAGSLTALLQGRWLAGRRDRLLGSAVDVNRH